MIDIAKLCRMSTASSRFLNARTFQTRKRKHIRLQVTWPRDVVWSARPLKISRGWHSWKRKAVEGETSPSSGITQERVLHESVAIDPRRELQPIVVQAKLMHPSGGWFGSVVLIFLLTIGTVAATLTAFMTYLRPTLKTFEETCRATEKASKQLESAAIELEEAAIMFDEKLPPALKSVEQASREFEELGQSLNSLSGGLLSRRPARHRRRGKETSKETTPADETKTQNALVTKQTTGQQRAVHSSKNITRQTIDSLNKVASDITSFTQNFRPAMDLWRKRLASIVTAAEARNGSSAETITKQLAVPVVMADGSQEKNGELGRTSSANSVMEGVSIEVAEKLAKGNALVDSDDYSDLDDLQVEDLFKDKDSLIARLASESTGDAASEIMDALYKAEQAAEDAARASGDLEEVVERARNSGEWQDFITWGDKDAPVSERTNEFFESDYSGTIRFDAVTLEAENSEEGSPETKAEE